MSLRVERQLSTASANAGSRNTTVFVQRAASAFAITATEPSDWNTSMRNTSPKPGSGCVTSGVSADDATLSSPPPIAITTSTLASPTHCAS